MQSTNETTSGTQGYNLGEFQVNSNVEISRDELGLIHGDEIQVKNNGQVLYEHPICIYAGDVVALRAQR